MDDQEKTIEDLEQQFPMQSGKAIGAAYKRAIASGQTVMQVIDGGLWEVSKFGKRKIKDVEPEFHIGVGTRFKIPRIQCPRVSDP